MKRVVATLATVAIATVVLFADDITVPRKAPELSFTLNGQPKLLSQYRGKVVALEFIFTTCPHCQAWTKIMNKFQDEFGPRGFQAIDVAVNPNADLLADNFARDYQTKFPVGWTWAKQAATFMGFSSEYFVVPQLALVDRKGVIQLQTPAREEQGGEWDKVMKEDVLRQRIEELLGSSSASRSHSATASHVAVATKKSS